MQISYSSLHASDALGFQEIESKRVMIEEKFKKIQEPLLQKRAQLEKDKKRHQFVRDVEDEDLWINETLPLAVTGTL